MSENDEHPLIRTHLALEEAAAGKYKRLKRELRYQAGYGDEPYSAAAADAIEALERERNQYRDESLIWIQKHIEMQRERDAAVADNAALLEAMHNIVALAPCECDHEVGMACQICMNATVLFGDHPGAALLAELARLRAVAEGWMLLAEAWPEMRQRCLAHYQVTLAALDAAESEAQ